MKVRAGFVSNSSSSSFIIIGTQIKFGDVFEQAEELIKANRLYAVGYATSDGADLFPMSSEMWKLYKEQGSRNSLYFYDIQKIIYDGGKIKKDEIIGDEIEVTTMTVDFHCCEHLSDFITRYMGSD